MLRTSFNIIVLPSVRKDIRRIPAMMLRRIRQAILQLADDPTPSGSKRLHTEEKGNFLRIRVGQYRIVYEVTHEIRIITVIRIGHRKNIYKNL